MASKAVGNTAEICRKLKENIVSYNMEHQGFYQKTVCATTFKTRTINKYLAEKKTKIKTQLKFKLPNRHGSH